MCVVCGRTDLYDGTGKGRDVWPKLRKLRWKQTTRPAEDGTRHWNCSVRREPGRNNVYPDKEIQRVELGSGDVPGLKP